MTWEKFKAMPFKKKAEHIWEYYRWHILVTVVLVFALGSWIQGIVTHKEPVLQLEMINCYGNTPNGEAFEDFLNQQGVPYDPDAVLVGKNIQLNGPDISITFGAAQMLACSIAAGEPDLIFWETDELMPALEGALLDLREILPQELLDEYADSLVYAVDEETGEEYPCGIYTERNPWMMENKYYVNCSVSVPATCKNRELAGAFIQYMLNYGK